MPPPASNLVWWVVPGVIGGMPMPWVHPERRENLGGGLTSFDDELPPLWGEGVRAVVCLLNIPGDRNVYQTAGFNFHFMPLPNGSAPTLKQFGAFVDFMETQTQKKNPVAVHCEAGLGRTGTVIAAYLIYTGMPARAAIERVRSVQPRSIETSAQVDFLQKLTVLR